MPFLLAISNQTQKDSGLNKQIWEKKKNKDTYKISNVF